MNNYIISIILIKYNQSSIVVYGEKIYQIVFMSNLQ